MLQYVVPVTSMSLQHPGNQDASVRMITAQSLSHSATHVCLQMRGRGLTVYCDLSEAGKWQTATLGFRGPSCPTWATAAVMAVSEYTFPSSPIAMPSAPGSVWMAGCAANLLRLLCLGVSLTLLCKA